MQAGTLSSLMPVWGLAQSYKQMNKKKEGRGKMGKDILKIPPFLEHQVETNSSTLKECRSNKGN
jgi:hypothetical protein